LYKTLYAVMSFTFFIMILLHPYFKGCKNMLKQYKGIVLAQVILCIMIAIFSAVQCFNNFIGMYLIYWQVFKQCNRTHMSHMHVYLKCFLQRSAVLWTSNRPSVYSSTSWWWWECKVSTNNVHVDWGTFEISF